MKRSIFGLLLVIYLIVATMPNDVKQSITEPNEDKELDDFSKNMESLYNFIEMYAPFVHDMTREAREKVLEAQENNNRDQ